MADIVIMVLGTKAAQKSVCYIISWLRGWWEKVCEFIYLFQHIMQT